MEKAQRFQVFRSGTVPRDLEKRKKGTDYNAIEKSIHKPKSEQLLTQSITCFNNLPSLRRSPISN